MKYHIFCLTFLSFLLINTMTISLAGIVWEKTYTIGDYSWAEAVRQANDGGYIMVGSSYTFEPNNGEDIFLLKTDAYGNEEWRRTYGGPDLDEGHDVQPTDDGGYIITGYEDYVYNEFRSWMTLIKTDQFGEEEWHIKYYNNVSCFLIYDYACSGNSVLQTLDDGYVVAGYTQIDASYYTAGIIKMFDEQGSGIWYDYLPHYGDACESYDVLNHVEQTSDLGFITVGSGVWDRDQPVKSILLHKFSLDGSYIWTKSYRDTEGNPEKSNYGHCVKQTDEEGYIILGLTYPLDSNKYDIWLIKTDATGNMLWDKKYGGSEYDYGSDLQKTSDNGFIIAGRTDSFGLELGCPWLIKVKPFGALQWDKIFYNKAGFSIYSVLETAEEGYIMAGFSSAEDHPGDVWLAYYDPKICETPILLTELSAYITLALIIVGAVLFMRKRYSSR